MEEKRKFKHEKEVKVKTMNAAFVINQQENTLVASIHCTTIQIKYIPHRVGEMIDFLNNFWSSLVENSKYLFLEILLTTPHCGDARFLL